MKNVAVSVRARLLNHSRATGTPFNAILEQYTTGRFLWRLSESAYRTKFILKGAQLFRLWDSELHRPTRDLDLLGFGDSSEEGMEIILNEICQLPSDPEDGLLWGEVNVSPIREDVKYGGVRAQLLATLDGARIPLQVDIGFGDIITPAAVESEWGGLLDYPVATLLSYPPETVIAEKLEAAVVLGISNSRMKDFYDLYWLSEHMSFDSGILSQAIHATFDRRGTKLPEEPPLALTAEFAEDPGKNTQWGAFLRKNKLTAPSFPQIIPRLSDFLMLVIQSQNTGLTWGPTQGWVEKGKASADKSPDCKRYRVG